MSDSCDDNLGHLDLPILSVILDSNFARCYRWWWAAAGEWGKGTWDFSELSLQLYEQIQLFQSKILLKQQNAS